VIAEFSTLHPVKFRISIHLSLSNQRFTLARSLPRYDFERLVEAAVKAGVELELNAQPEEFSYGRT
jgi:hypothetical protein